MPLPRWRHWTRRHDISRVARGGALHFAALAQLRSPSFRPKAQPVTSKSLPPMVSGAPTTPSLTRSSISSTWGWSGGRQGQCRACFRGQAAHQSRPSRAERLAGAVAPRWRPSSRWWAPHSWPAAAPPCRSRATRARPRRARGRRRAASATWPHRGRSRPVGRNQRRRRRFGAFCGDVRRPRRASKLLGRRSGVRRSGLSPWSHQAGAWGGVLRQGGRRFQPAGGRGRRR